VITSLATAGDAELAQFKKLADISRALTYCTSLDEVAQLTVVRGAELLEAASAVVMLQDADDLLHVRAVHGVPEAVFARFRAPLSGEVIGRLQGLLAVPDDQLLAVPLVVRGVVTGLVAVALRKPSTPANDWSMAALADQVAIALENARLAGEVRLEMESRLRASEGATNAKDRALSTLAHDIRSPLGAIEGYCTILEDGIYGPVTDKQLEALGRVRMSGRHLLSLLDNVMDMARLSAGAVRVRAERVALTTVAQEAVDIMTPASHARRQSLTITGGPDVLVTADGARVRQVLVNLIGNAVKFTEANGQITIGIVEHSMGFTRWGGVRVTDTGPGIAALDRVSIFEPYFRSEGTAAIPGVGLGLAISSALVKQMGGRLEVESELAVGSSFTLWLPCWS